MEGHQQSTNSESNFNENKSCKELLHRIDNEFKDLKKLLEKNKDKINESIGSESEIELLSEEIVREFEEINQYVKSLRSGYLIGKSDEELEEFWLKFEVSIKIGQSNTQKLEKRHSLLFVKLKALQTWIQKVQTEIQIISEDIDDFRNNLIPH